MHTRNPLRSLAFLCCFAALLSWLAGCGAGKLLLNRETVAKLSYTPSSEHRIIFFEKLFTYDQSGKQRETTHQIVRVGQNANALSPALVVHDNTIDKLLEFEARVIHSDGDVETFSSSDLTNFNLSNSRQIAERYLKSAYVKEKITPGDLIETVWVHECTLPQLGIQFSLSELDYSAENISCSIEVRVGDTLQYLVANDNLTPSRKDTLGMKTFTFKWKSYAQPSHKRHELEKTNRAPALYAVRGPQSWRSYGDWYADLLASKLQAGSEVAKAAHDIADSKSTAKEKLDAIFEYCQRNVRYELVALAQGEIIPNHVDATFARKYGDCKDYSSLMHAMARSVGVKTDLALCYRGRGREFFDEMPVSQFNHLILHFEDNGRHYWYDGTNRVGLSGVTTFDLVNARALVIEKEHSRLATIQESADNLLSITGALRGNASNGLSGDVTIEFRNQFAIDFFWLDFQTNHEKMTTYLTETLQEILNEDIIVQHLAWKSEKSNFSITATCEFPNCVTSLQGNSYTGISRVLPALLPREQGTAERNLTFYFPYYNRVSLDLTLADFMIFGQPEPAKLQLKYELPVGPFDASTRTNFHSRLDSVLNSFSVAHKLTHRPS
ncbi:MAG: transglutaminase domain-containing protein [Ignavibacteriae bacterium]|nr:transglutaminase domain-containing protein [Ignavibacteriota bacterium]